MIIKNNSRTHEFYVSLRRFWTKNTVKFEKWARIYSKISSNRSSFDHLKSIWQSCDYITEFQASILNVHAKYFLVTCSDLKSSTTVVSRKLMLRHWDEVLNANKMQKTTHIWNLKIYSFISSSVSLIDRAVLFAMAELNRRFK